MITTPLSPGGGGGGTGRVVQKAGPSSARSSPAALFWRSAGPSAAIRTCGNVSSYSTRTPLRAYAVASQTMNPGLDITDVGGAPTMPSPDLRDMATLQLGMLYQLLSMAGNNYSSMRCTVYARTFMDVGPGQVKLVRVAKFPVTPGQGDDLHNAQQSSLLLHTEQSWALQGGSAAVDPSGLIEDCLLQREVVALPHSSALVFPLVDSGVLVGLLVVEQQQQSVDASVAAAGAVAGQPGVGSSSNSGQPAADTAFASIPALAAGGAAAMLPKLCLAREEAARAAERSGSSSDSSGSSVSGVQECSVEGLLDDGVEGERARAGHHRTLTDEEMRCLRLAVPLLAKACGMDARASWQVAQSSLTAAAARGLLREAQRPLSTLNTFGSMLVPRLKDGEPDKDMAKGILLQGRRLQDLVWQLEEALHGPSPQAAAAAAAAAGMPVATAAGGAALPSGASVVTGGVALGPGAGVTGIAAGLGAGLGSGPASPFRSPVALPLDQSPAVQELLQLPPPRPVALPPRAAPDEPAAPAVDTATPQGLASPPPVHPGRVTYAEPATPSSTLEPSSSAPGSAPFTIRQPAARPAPAGPGAAMATIDVETDSSSSDAACAAGGAGAESSAPGSPRAGALPSALAVERAGAGGGAVGAAGPFSWASGPAVSTNLVAALAGVLTAACRLAAVSGIGFIVNSPLSAVLPRRSTGKARAPGAGSAADAAALGAAGDRAPRVVRPSSASSSLGADLDSVVEGPRLIPRPARPLLVGVRAALVAKIVGYMLDICLQSTPRGGQLCVSARQDGAGVQLVLLHTGRMDLQRLHMRSRSLMAATTSPAAAAAASAVPVMATAAAAASRAASSHAAVAGRGSGPPQQQPPSVGAPAGASGAQAGSGVLSVELAQELAQQAGGHLTVSYPCNMVNASSGSLDLGTSVEIWLPGPGALN
ncbi:hypothetical protein HYH02_001805 [Chlamydomonas schloesseri]|uniref:Uncharacterized protein n=1 Tax=Chlamydomonas schloesseri TaxID=2026947 RepID=A0A835WUB7_9CHLO|nr:hypothetical protein HYH02_001805 [Chlamydomonas schloesseri]|eukprot:KAG2453587.1 hypothetical protein HYH02_001805 [Chlamydomonas schloesseri]